MISGYSKLYCCEDVSTIENYDKAINDDNMWVCHHKLEIQNDKIFRAKELKSLGLYYHRPANELIFLTDSEHKKLHATGDAHPFKGHTHSDKSKELISEKKKGQVSGMKGKHQSESAREKLRIARRNQPDPRLGKKHTEEAKKRMSESHKGQIAWNKGLKGCKCPTKGKHRVWDDETHTHYHFE